MSNKLLLAVNFLGVDKLSGSIRNIVASSKAGSASLKDMKAEVRALERELKDVRKAQDMGTGSWSQLALRERELTQQIEQTNRKLDERRTKLERIARIRSRADNVADKAGSIGGAATIGVTAPILAFAATSIQASREASAAMAQTRASIQSMGNTAGRSFEQLQAQAGDLMKQSLFDDDEILRSVTANLLTFGKVTGTTFDRAQLAAVNLSAKLGTDLQSSTMMVGKALNDPVKGLTALTRSGVSFTAEQKEMVKAMVASGKTAQAQALILAELDKQFGGSAAAARLADPVGAAALQFGEFQQAIGDKLLPNLIPLVNVLGGVLDKFNALSPGTQQFLIIAGGAAAAFGPLLLGISGIASAVSMAAPLLPILGSAIAALLSPVGLVVAAVAGLGYIIYANWDRIKTAFATGVDWIAAKLTAAKAWFTNIGGQIMDGLLLMLNPARLGARMIEIARAGVTAFKNFFGIKSPSRLMMAMGGHVAGGLSMGLDRGAGGATRSMSRLAAGVTGAAALGLAAPALGAAPGTGRPPAPATGAVTYNVTIKLDGLDTQDPRAAAQAIKRELDALLAQEARGSYADG